MKKKINWFIVIFSLIGIACLILSYFVHWSFVIITLITFVINQVKLKK